MMIVDGARNLAVAEPWQIKTLSTIDNEYEVGPWELVMTYKKGGPVGPGVAPRRLTWLKHAPGQGLCTSTKVDDHRLNIKILYVYVYYVLNTCMYVLNACIYVVDHFCSSVFCFFTFVLSLFLVFWGLICSLRN
jgi:hypothetical protein